MDIKFKKIILQSKPYLKFFLTCENILYDMFGEENVDFGFTTMNTPYIIIKFSEITIKNNSLKHLIKDMYVRILLDRYQPKLQGWRGTKSIFEHLASYSHSHLPIGCFKFSDFCLGNSEFSTIFRDFKNSTDSFTLFCLSLPQFLAWESLEGVPYIRMREVKKQELAYFSFKKKIFELHLDYVVTNFAKQKHENFDIIFENGNLKIKKNEYYIETLKDYLISSLEKEINVIENLFGYLLEGTFYSLAEIGESSVAIVNNTVPTVNNNSIVFKNKVVELKIENTHSVLSNIKTKVDNYQDLDLNPAIIDRITKKIENLLNKNYETVKYKKYRELCCS